jgi:hypothetical protein
MNILDAMQDPDLFGKTFRRSLLRGDTWRAWRAFLAALFGLALEGEALDTFRKHTARQDAPAEPFREAFVIAGRRSGKSLIAALIAVFLACFKTYEAVLAPGEVGTVMILGADRRQCRVIFSYIDAFLSVPILARMVTARLKESIELNNRIKVEIHTSSFRAVRGYTIVGAICDEVAFWPSEDSARPDIETLTALRPAMATVPGALLLGISSAYARRGALWEAYKENFGKSDSSVLVWKAATREMNPTVSSLVIDAAYLRDHAAASAEYGAEFRTDVEGFLSLEVIEPCVVPDRRELPPLGSANYAAFVDPSGGSSDSFTLAIAHREHDRAVLDLIREVQAPFSPESVVQEFSDILKRYRISTVTGDRYAGEWPAEQFAKRGIQYRPAERTRSELYLELLPALASRQCELLDNKRLMAQLASLERRTSRVGRDSIDHAPGGHDDVANAAAGALVEAVGREPVLGLIEYLKQEQAAADSAIARPADEVACPQCGSRGIAKRGPILHCTNCAHEFGGPPKEIGPPPRAGLFESSSRQKY